MTTHPDALRWALLTVAVLVAVVHVRRLLTPRRSPAEFAHLLAGLAMVAMLLPSVGLAVRTVSAAAVGLCGAWLLVTGVRTYVLDGVVQRARLSAAAESLTTAFVVGGVAAASYRARGTGMGDMTLPWPSAAAAGALLVGAALLATDRPACADPTRVACRWAMATGMCLMLVRW